MKNKTLFIFMAILNIAVNSSAQKTSTFTDSRDKIIYKTVTIADQIWIAENLKFKTDSGSFCYNDIDSNCTKYGRLYTWVAALKACPTGWHLPTHSEWKTLSANLGGDDAAGGKLKSTSNWANSDTGATNSSGFTGLPGGYRNNGTYKLIGYFGSWWCSSESDKIYARAWNLEFRGTHLLKTNVSKTDASSVRCIKD